MEVALWYGPAATHPIQFGLSFFVLRKHFRLKSTNNTLCINLAQGRASSLEVVQKYWICYLVTGIFKQFHGTDIGCVR
jgi:hypothetical protein